jgi:hypothetical protein
LSDTTAIFSTSQPEHFSQRPQQRHIWFNVNIVNGAVYFEFHEECPKSKELRLNIPESITEVSRIFAGPNKEQFNVLKRHLVHSSA